MFKLISIATIDTVIKISQNKLAIGTAVQRVNTKRGTAIANAAAGSAATEIRASIAATTAARKKNDNATANPALAIPAKSYYCRNI